MSLPEGLQSKGKINFVSEGDGVNKKKPWNCNWKLNKVTSIDVGRRKSGKKCTYYLYSSTHIEIGVKRSVITAFFNPWHFFYEVIRGYWHPIASVINTYISSIYYTRIYSTYTKAKPNSRKFRFVFFLACFETRETLWKIAAAIMLPPIGSPTSPQDVQMTDLNILTVGPEPQHQKLPSPVDNRPLNSHSPISLSSVKSTNTLRNNIDVKNELNKKRTSLNLHENGNAEMFNACDTASTSSSSSSSSSSPSSSSSSSSMGQQPLKLATVKRCSRNLDNARYRRELQNINSNSTANNSHDNVNNNVNASRLFNRSSSDSDVADSKPQHIDTVAVVVNENGKMHRRIRRKVQDKSQNGNAPQNASDNDDDDNNISRNDRNRNDSNDNENNEFNDRRNGNTSDRSTQKRDSITSKESGSSDDYFLCEKFKNTLNAKLCDAVVNGAVVLDENGEPNRRLSLELLSPHEGPLGRRYAEIAPSKNNTNTNKW